MLDGSVGRFVSKAIFFPSSSFVDRRPLSPASLSKCDNLLKRLAEFYKYHGINIKTCYGDFDKHHIGVVTESQVLNYTHDLAYSSVAELIILVIGSWS